MNVQFSNYSYSQPAQKEGRVLECRPDEWLCVSAFMTAWIALGLPEKCRDISEDGLWFRGYSGENRPLK